MDVSVAIDVDVLRARPRAARSTPHPACDAWLDLAGASGQEAFELVVGTSAAVSP